LDCSKPEVLLKFLCHNICCLMMAQHELGIEPVFYGEPVAKVPIKEAAEVTPVASVTTTEAYDFAMDDDFRCSD
jgi:hypothetical protein